MFKKLKRNLILFLTLTLLTVSAAPAFSAAAESEEYGITSTLTDGATVKSSKKTFFVTAKDENGNKVTPTVTLNGQNVDVTWDDIDMTSFTLKFTEEGENKIVITAGDKSVTYTLIYQKAAPGEIIGYTTVSVEALTIGCGHIIEPVLVPIHEGETVAMVITKLLEENGFSYNCTGSVESSFYLAAIGRGGALKKGSDKSFGAGEKFSVPEELDEKLINPILLENITKFSELDTGWSEGENTLGEFDYTVMSGWMYTVNNTMANVGMSQYELSDGEVVRLHFTLYGYGSDLGYSVWGMEKYYETANKDALLTEIAQINALPNLKELLGNEKFAAAYKNAMALALNLTAPQSDVAVANKELSVAKAAAIKELENKNQTPPDNGSTGGNSEQKPNGGNANSSGKTNADTEAKSPKTGDNGQAAAFEIISVALAFAMISAAQLKRRHN